MLDTANTCSKGQYICQQAYCKELWPQHGWALGLLTAQRDRAPWAETCPLTEETWVRKSSAFPEKSIKKGQHHYYMSYSAQKFLWRTLYGGLAFLVSIYWWAHLSIPFVIRGTDSFTGWFHVITFPESPFPLKILLGALLSPLPSLSSQYNQAAYWVPALETVGCLNSSKMTPDLQSPITDEITKSKYTEIVLEENLLWKERDGRDYEREQWKWMCCCPNRM